MRRATAARRHFPPTPGIGQTRNISQGILQRKWTECWADSLRIYALINASVLMPEADLPVACLRPTDPQTRLLVQTSPS